jgi:hypothetical protein
MMMQGLIAVVGAGVQSLLSLFVAAVIAALTAVRSALRTPEADVIAGSALLNADGQLGSTLMTGRVDGVHAFTG